MVSTTIIAGMRGTGKSTLLARYKSQAITIETEKVQALAVKMSKGKSIERPHSWDHWDFELRQQAGSLLSAALILIYPALSRDDGRPLLIAGAILVHNWFSGALIENLAKIFPVQFRDVKRYILHLDEQTISDQIETRGRANERDYIGCLTRIAEIRNRYWELADQCWEPVESQAAMECILESRLVSNQNT